MHLFYTSILGNRMFIYFSQCWNILASQDCILELRYLSAAQVCVCVCVCSCVRRGWELAVLAQWQYAGLEVSRSRD